MTICAFDFDGTLIKKDSFLEFLKFTHGLPVLYFSFILFSPILILYKLKIIPNYKAKQLLFSWFYKNWTLTDFENKCKLFADSISYLNTDVYSELTNHLEKKHEVIIISASIENWIIPWAHKHGVKVVCGTQIEIDSNGFLTGKFKSKNCYGIEKVNRLLELYPDRNNYTLYAYGDSSGDKEMFELADYKIKVRC